MLIIGLTFRQSLMVVFTISIFLYIMFYKSAFVVVCM